MRLIILASCLLLLGISCKKANTHSSTVGNPTRADTLLNTSYGADPHQKMDIYLPANRSVSATKVLLLVHGGGWTGGDKADFSGSVTAFQNSLPDYAIVNINYRLAGNNQNLFPTQENDLKAAADFVFAKRNEYFISDKWAFLGASAGGHLVLLQSYKYSSPVQPKAVISFFGPTDLTSFYNSGSAAALALINVTGTTPTANPERYQQSSPIRFVRAQSPPTLLLQGDADPLVPPAQAALLRDKLQLLAVPNQYILYPNEGHGWVGADLLDSYSRTVAFLKQYVN